MGHNTLNGYPYDPMDCVWPGVATDPGKYKEKTVGSFCTILVLVSEPGSMSPFVRDELLAPALHFITVR